MLCVCVCVFGVGWGWGGGGWKGDREERVEAGWRDE